MEVSGQLHDSVALPSGGRASGTHWIGWVGPRTGLDDVEREESCPYRYSAAQLVARHTDRMKEIVECNLSGGSIDEGTSVTVS
jgi:hypothetical protein